MRNHERCFRNMPSKLKLAWTFGLLLCFLGFAVYGTGGSATESAYAQNAKTISRNTQSGTSGAIKVFDVDCDYGTLAFKGRIERTDMGNKYKFRTQIAVVFLPGETLNGYTMTNRTKIADLKFCDLVASVVPANRQPVEVLHKEAHPIAVRLTEYGEVGVLPDLEFYVTKSIADRATHIGLGVTDGKLYWPIPTELK